jgi:uncharacterized protein involved in exopolysaccharide biosynthesis
MQLLDRTSQDLQQLETRKSSLEAQQVYLEAQLAQLKPNSALFSDSGERIMSTPDRLKTLRSQLASARALYAPDHPDIARLSREIAGLEGQSKEPVNVNDLRRSLDETRAQLAQSSERYSSDHPDRLRLERQVAALESELAAATAAAAKQPAQAAAQQTADNPAYIQIQSQLASTRNDLQALAAQRERLHHEVDEYRRKITLSPQIEKEYRELTRDYENARSKYQELRSKQGEATVAKNLEADRKGERFTLIEPPLPPQQPVSPNRPVVFALGALLSIIVAIGVAALFESLDATVRGRRDLVSLVAGVAPLAIIPLISTEVSEPRPWRRAAIVAAVAVAVLAVGAIAIDYFYQPLDVLWFVLLRRIGLG